MRLIAFLFLQLASMAVAYCATSQDKKVSADQLYTQVTRLGSTNGADTRFCHLLSVALQVLFVGIGL